MQPPIPIGTILQNRYHLLNILGQGGFGRTYLAEDRGRFNERCAIKEFFPAQTSAYSLEKAQELFQREAAILYQIQHPQIPQFRATFQQDGRFFLIQDYVEGPSYLALMQERKNLGQSFTELEVLQLLRQLLPVLAHIHAKNIIHRDISPDNIILRTSDRLPVLIDFGVVKEIATRIQAPDQPESSTTVGKAGYAPTEQIQTGRAYPSSDLYSLAVTSIVLLTSREPQELFDDTQLTWNWQRWTSVSPGFANILNRMLSYRPSDRYQSVSEVAQALQTLPNPGSNYPQQPIAQPPNPQLPGANISQVQTVAVGRCPQPIAPHNRRPHQPDPVIPDPNQNSFWNNTGAMIAVMVSVVLLVGIGTWAIISSILNRQTAQTTPTPTVSPTQTPSPSPITPPTSSPSQFIVEKLAFPPGQVYVEAKDRTSPQEIKRYQIVAQKGQILKVEIIRGAATFNIRYPNGEIIKEASNLNLGKVK